MATKKTKAEKAEEIVTAPEAEAVETKIDETNEVEPTEKVEEIKVPEELRVPTREGYVIYARKPVFGDRRWMFMQPEGLNLPSEEVLPASCITKITKLEAGKEVPVELVPEGVHPWFNLERCGIEGPMVFMTLWNRTYMPSQTSMAQGFAYAMAELAKGNA